MGLKLSNFSFDEFDRIRRMVWYDIFIFLKKKIESKGEESQIMGQKQTGEFTVIASKVPTATFL